MSFEVQFAEDAVEVAGIGRFKLVGYPSKEELFQFGPDFERLIAGYTALRAALDAFETGGAVYKDCLANVLDLQDGIRNAYRELEKGYQAIGTYFEPMKSPLDEVVQSQRPQLAIALLQGFAARAMETGRKPAGEPTKEVVG
jgi:hypothetical protein